MTDPQLEVLTEDPYAGIHSPHERNANQLRDNPDLHGKWCIMQKYTNKDSPAHQAWRLKTKVFGPKGRSPDDHFDFRSKWFDMSDGSRIYCLLGKYEP